MLKFFRKIRQQLLSENHFSKYLLYALGEILLVMVGILLALQVNNWNEQGKANRIEVAYLKALQEEFQQNLLELEQVGFLLEKQIQAADSLLQFTGPNIPSLSELRFSLLFKSALKDYAKFYPRNGVLQDILSSGKLNVFQNAKLREKLASWESKTDRLKEIEKEVETYSSNTHLHLKEYGNMRRQIALTEGIYKIQSSQFEGTNLALLKLETFENQLTGFTVVSAILKRVHYPNIQKEMEEILSLIQLELK